MTFAPRKWQQDCFARFKERIDEGQSSFALEACMGSGKSAMAAWLAKTLLDDYGIDHVLVLVPWRSIQGDPEKGMLGAFGKLFGLDARDHFFSLSKRISQQPIPQIDATITLYQEVCNQAAIDTLKLWMSKGFRFAMICDEIHHTNEINGTWGEYVGKMKELADYSIFMSGTYFRSDKKAVGCIDLDQDGNPIKHYAYTYQMGVRDDVVRSVTTRHINANVSMFDPATDRKYDVELSEVGNRELSAAKKQVLDPTGECIRYMIQAVHEGLMKTRTKFRDAACLFVCRPGSSGDFTQEGNESLEDKYVNLIAKQIKDLTNENPTVVTHHDKDATGKIGRFRKSSDPYLVAVNMVSEGCDIPRLRAVAFCRYTDSEMLFRQIVGRALRLHIDERSGVKYEDGTAAQIYIPTFPLLVQFAESLWDEAQSGVQARRCPRCDLWPCECPCPNCLERPCVCPCRNCGANPCECDSANSSPQPIGLDAIPLFDGGRMGKDPVGEAWVQLASKVAETVVQHLHANPVQFGHFLQAAERFRNTGTPQPLINPAQDRERMVRRINRVIRRIAIDVYAKDYAKAYYREIEVPFKAKLKVILSTWPVERLREVEDRLEKRIVEVPAAMAKKVKELTQQNFDAIRNHLFDRIHTTGEVIKNNFPNILRTAIETEAWQHFRDNDGKPFEDLVAWLHYTFPNGVSMGQGQNAITYEEALALTEGHPEVHKTLATNAPKKPVGGDKRSKNALNFHAVARPHDFLRHSSKSRAVLMARLAQEYPKFYDAFMAGKYKSLRAATDAAGLTKPGHKPLSRLKSDWNRATKKERDEFLKWMKEQDD